MSAATRRLVAFAVLIAPLLIAAVLLSLSRSGEPPAPAVSAAKPAPAPLGDPGRSPEQLERELPGLIESAEQAHEERIAADFAAPQEPGPSPQALLPQVEAARAATPVAWRFWAAYSRFEVGESSARIERELSATATASYARELLQRAALRLPAGVQTPAAGELGALQFVAIAGDRPAAELEAAELVGEVDRDGKRSPIALSVVLEGGQWRVARLGR